MNKIKRKLKIFKNRTIKKRINNFFDWVKGAEIVELQVNEKTQNFEYKI